MSARALRVAVVAARYPPLSGGVELHTEQVSQRLAAAGVDVTVLTTDLSGELPAAEERDGVRIRRLPAWPRGRDYYLCPGIYRELVGGDWDLVHVQGFQTLVAPTAMLAALRARLPYVVTFHAGGHSARLRKALAPAQERVLRPLLRRAERLVALTPAEADERARRLGVPRERFAVIPNGADLPDESAAASVRDPDLIASIGRLERYKGHHRVLAALPHVLARRPRTRLWIGGGGPFEQALREQAAELGVADRVDIRAIPLEERARMAAELARVSVVVCLSEFESQGIAVFEALGQGCRTVVARAPGLIALVDEGLARGVELDAPPEEVARVVVEELQRPPLPSPPDLPTWDGCADAVLALYLEVTRPR